MKYQRSAYTHSSQNSHSHNKPRYLDVRLNGVGFVVRNFYDEKRGIFSGFDDMNEKHLRISYRLVKALLERPKESVILGRNGRNRAKMLNFIFDILVFPYWRERSEDCYGAGQQEQR